MQGLAIILFPVLVLFMPGAAGVSPATFVVAKLPKSGKNVIILCTLLEWSLSTKAAQLSVPLSSNYILKSHLDTFIFTSPKIVSVHGKSWEVFKTLQHQGCQDATLIII